MTTIAVYNMKGGVGKTTTAVNLAYLAAAAGHRTLLWDLDPQAASTFAYRIRPHVAALGRSRSTDAAALYAAIRQSDYDNLCVLPADFACHKLDGWLSSLDDATGVFATQLDTIGREFDVVLLDCPAGFSRLVEATLATADAVLAPTIPTVLSLRTLARVLKQGERLPVRGIAAAFFNMVDRRKTLHRNACALAASPGGPFLSTSVPYASVVEQLATRRMPVSVFAAHAPAARAFSDLWFELQRRLASAEDQHAAQSWASARQMVGWVIEQLETTERPAAATAAAASGERASAEQGDAIVHTFDTDRHDLARTGLRVEVREQNGEFLVVVRCDAAQSSDGQAEVRIDRCWTVQILSGDMSPLEALERRLGSPWPRAVEQIRIATGARALRRIDTRRGTRSDDCPTTDTAAAAVPIDRDRVVGF